MTIKQHYAPIPACHSARIAIHPAPARLSGAAAHHAAVKRAQRAGQRRPRVMTTRMEGGVAVVALQSARPCACCGFKTCVKEQKQRLAAAVLASERHTSAAKFSEPLLPAPAPEAGALRYACGSDVRVGDVVEHINGREQHTIVALNEDCSGQPKADAARVGNSMGIIRVPTHWRLLSRAEHAAALEQSPDLPPGWKHEGGIERPAYRHSTGAYAAASLDVEGEWFWLTPRIEHRVRDGYAPTKLQAMCAALGVVLRESRFDRGRWVAGKSLEDAFWVGVDERAIDTCDIEAVARLALERQGGAR